MRSLTFRGVFRRLLRVGSAAMAIICVGLASDVGGEPRYWAGDISFVTQASYAEEAPKTAVPAEPTPTHSPRTVTPEPWSATPTVAQPNLAEPIETPLAAPPRQVNHVRQPISSSSSRFVQFAPAPVPRHMPVQPAAPQTFARPTKPFESAASPTTISPYLNLFREDADAEVVPNYHAFVRPQLEQQEANRRQQLELQQIERKLQSGQTAGAAAGGVDPSNRRLPARFMNTAQFYSGWQR